VGTLDPLVKNADRDFVGRAAALGERGRRTAPPNPWVGCVLVRDGEVVGEGFHERPGGPHAEVVALRAAGERSRGATAYVTLEPCAHHGRTPPCADGLVAAGVARVVVALRDPDPRVSGRGIAVLEAAGVAVEVGPGEEIAARSLRPYLHQRRTGRAFALLKVATSLDGRTAAADGSSQWITGPEARADAHRLRAESQAVVVGAGTALADGPSLTARDVRPPAERQPLRVLLDARGRVPADGPLFDITLAPTLVVTTDAADSVVLDAWCAAGAKVEVVAPAEGGVDLAATLELLARHGVVQALVEGGGTLHGALVREQLADGLVAYLAPIVLGDGARPLAAGLAPALTDAPRFHLESTTAVGDDLRLDLTAAA
jgi:diaminohydroxyphosphoribosylaminopyrimidine deaminase/5-amino-6-(5-phosphoribosylamino)uracil reductase